MGRMCCSQRASAQIGRCTSSVRRACSFGFIKAEVLGSSQILLAMLYPTPLQKIRASTPVSVSTTGIFLCLHCLFDSPAVLRNSDTIYTFRPTQPCTCVCVCSLTGNIEQPWFVFNQEQRFSIRGSSQAVPGTFEYDLAVRCRAAS